jgi:hypothetical protein
MMMMMSPEHKFYFVKLRLQVGQTCGGFGIVIELCDKQKQMKTRVISITDKV